MSQIPHVASSSRTIYVNGEARESAALTVLELLESMQLVGKRVAVEKNGEIVAKGQHASTPIAENDRFEIVVAVGGG
jgi:sulfur carrier protein